MHQVLQMGWLPAMDRSETAQAHFKRYIECVPACSRLHECRLGWVGQQSMAWQQRQQLAARASISRWHRRRRHPFAISTSHDKCLGVIRSVHDGSKVQVGIASASRDAPIGSNCPGFTTDDLLLDNNHVWYEQRGSKCAVQ